MYPPANLTFSAFGNESRVLFTSDPPVQFPVATPEASFETTSYEPLHLHCPPRGWLPIAGDTPPPPPPPPKATLTLAPRAASPVKLGVPPNVPVSRYSGPASYDPSSASSLVSSRSNSSRAVNDSSSVSWDWFVIAPRAL